MPKAVSDLIKKIRSEYPELKDEPMMDELEDLAYMDEEEEPMDDEMLPEDDMALEDELPMDEEPLPEEDELPPEDEEDMDLSMLDMDEEEESPARELPASFKRRKRK